MPAPPEPLPPTLPEGLPFTTHAPAEHVFPTLTALNLAHGEWLAVLTPIARTFVLVTIAVPIVIYGVMPHLHRARARILRRT